ncbi:hypothetical protein MMC12_005560 [Toensbergia leucococca]|nr:hypothetical protein [Toensbergia leucococca]
MSSSSEPPHPDINHYIVYPNGQLQNDIACFGIERDYLQDLKLSLQHKNAILENMLRRPLPQSVLMTEEQWPKYWSELRQLKLLVVLADTKEAIDTLKAENGALSLENETLEREIGISFDEESRSDIRG